MKYPQYIKRINKKEEDIGDIDYIKISETQTVVITKSNDWGTETFVIEIEKTKLII
jgi:hypothetical protein